MGTSLGGVTTGRGPPATPGRLLSRTRPLPRTLDCVLTAATYLEIAKHQKTSVAGTYVAGDATIPMRAVSVAVAAGTTAGVFLKRAIRPVLED